MLSFNFQNLQDIFHNSNFTSKFKRNFVYLLILIIQNLIIFWQHYFNDAGFPWDFNLTIYGLPAFLTTAWSLGIFPEWIPFQNMGYPLAMLPMDTFYPAYWIFSLLGIQYTIHVAVITQTIHVLFGTFGMYLLLCTLFKSPKYALIGALAFQFFGGFFTNAQHDNFIRSYAMGPWLFYVFYLGFNQLKENKISKRVFSIPLLVFLLGTGAVGNFFPSLFIMGTFVFSQLIRGHFNGLRNKKLVFIFLFLLLLISLGTAMSVVNFGPPIQEIDYLERTEIFEDIPHKGFTSNLLPALFLSSKLIPENLPPMASAFVTLPILILASFLPLSELKKYWIFFVPLVISVLMLPGQHSPFYEFITSIIPPLHFTRFPSVEYRIFLAIPIIIFGILSLKTIIEKRPSWKFILIRSIFVSIWFVTGMLMIYSGIVDSQVILAIFIMLLTILTITYSSRIIKSIENSKNLLLKKKILLPFVIFTLLILINGFSVISDIPTWVTPSTTKAYSENYVTLVEDGKLVTFSIFENLPSERPEREITPSKAAFSWKGYLTGKYMMQDSIKGGILKPRMIVESNDIYTEYMFMKWTPILLDPNSVQINNEKINLEQKTFTNLKSSDRDFIKQTHYGIDDITYKVSLNKPTLLVENEMYFPGWKAILIYPDKEIEINALVTNEVFRSWLLPQGDYEMKAYFQFPNLILYKIISVIAFLIWISIVIIYLRTIFSRPYPKLN